MKTFISVLSFLFVSNTFALDKIQLDVKVFTEYLCTINNAFNMKGCMTNLRECIDMTMSQRINVPLESETERFLRAISYCSPN